MSRQVFVDTSALLALADPDSPNHERAVDLIPYLDGPMVTSNLVLIEVALRLGYHSGQRAAREVLSRLRGDDTLKVLHVSPDLEAAAWDLHGGLEGEQSPSIVHASSIVLMRELGIRIVFTFDEAFRDRGLVTLPIG